MNQVVLQSLGLVKRFDGIVATDHVDLSLTLGARHALIGPNGAGKTTLINLLTGVIPPTAGRIDLLGQDISRLPSHERVRRGLVRTFQINQLFASMTPLQTLAMTVSQQRGHARRWWQPLGSDPSVIERCESLLELFKLTREMHQNTRELPYGKRRLLEMAIALACEPKVLLLDEPMAGMNVEEKQDMCRFILDVNDEFGTTIVLIEHDMGVVMDISDRVVVLDYGKKIGDGAPDEVRNNEEVISAYLGTSH